MPSVFFSALFGMISLLLLPPIPGIHALTSLRPPIMRSREDSLYDPATDFVVSVNASTIGTIFERDQAFLVEFYSSWCGHCQAFAPIWKELAQKVRYWRPVITVAAINCASSANAPTCRLFDIRGYPVLKLFPAQASVDHRGSLVDVSTVSNERMVSVLSQKMMNFVVMHPHFDRPASWPEMPQNLTNVKEDAWRQIEIALSTAGVEKVVVVFGKSSEKDSVFFARSVALDFSQVGKAVRFYAVYDAARGGDATLSSLLNVDVHSLPALVILSSSNLTDATIWSASNWPQERERLLRIPDFQYSLASFGIHEDSVVVGSQSPTEGTLFGCLLATL